MSRRCGTRLSVCPARRAAPCCGDVPMQAMQLDADLLCVVRADLGDQENDGETLTSQGRSAMCPPDILSRARSLPCVLCALPYEHSTNKSGTYQCGTHALQTTRHTL